MHSPATRASCVLVSLGLLLSVTRPAMAQYGYGTFDPATGEDYHVEIGGTLWSPSNDVVISSESLGIPGSDIDFANDLGIERQRFGEVRLVLRPAKKHKFRGQFLPMSWTAESILNRTVVFNGIQYDVGTPVASTLNLTTWRLGYEYDFITRDRGFLGALVEAKYTSVQAQIESVLGTEYAQARTPIPALGLIGRGYLARNVSVTGEVTAFRLPNISDEYGGNYLDFDVAATLNLVEQFGIQAGFRSITVFYKVEDDTGNLKFRGPYLGGIVRF